MPEPLDPSELGTPLADTFDLPTSFTELVERHAEIIARLQRQPRPCAPADYRRR